MSDTASFFEFLFGPTLPQNTAIRVRVLVTDRDIGTNRPVGVTSKYYTEIRKMPTEWPSDANVLFGAALRAEGTRDRCVLWTFLWADYDKPDYLPPADFPLPSAIVRSGAHLHLYWKLRTAFTQDDIEQVRRLLRLIRNAIGADDGASDPQHLLRMPGTHNVKRADSPLCQLLELHPDRLYDASDFGSPEDITDLPPDEKLPNDEPPIVSEPQDFATVVLDEQKEYLKKFMWRVPGWTEEILSFNRNIKSHSHLLWHVAAALASSPANDGKGYSKAQAKGFMLASPGLMREKERNKPDYYLDRAIHRAFKHIERQRTAQAAGDRTGLRTLNDELYRVMRDKEGQSRTGPQVSNFMVSEVHAVLEAGGFRVTLAIPRRHLYVPVTITQEIISSTRDWVRRMPSTDFVWFGNNEDLRRFQAYLGEQGAPRKRGTDILGWHKNASGQWEYLVTSREVYGLNKQEPTCPIEYAGDMEWRLTPPSETWAKKVHEALELLLRLHDPLVCLALLGWVMSTFVAPQLREIRGGSSTGETLGELYGIWAWGIQGSGKSGTIQPFVRLTGAPESFIEVSAQNSTVAGLERAIASSNVTPLFLDDPRRYHMNDKEHEKLKTILRNVLNAVGTQLANVSSVTGTRRRRMLAPVIVASESAIEHDEALESRYFYVPFDRRWFEEHSSATAQVLMRLSAMDLPSLALGIFWKLWNIDVEKAWNKAHVLTAFLSSRSDAFRPRKALTQIMMGLLLAKELDSTLDLGYDMLDIGPKLWHRASGGGEGDDVAGVSVSASHDTTIRRIWRLVKGWIQDHKLKENETFLPPRRDGGDRLSVNLDRLISLASQDREQSGLPLTRSVILSAFAAYAGSVVTIDTVKFGGPTNLPLCAVWNLHTIKTQWKDEDEPWNSIETLPY